MQGRDMNMLVCVCSSQCLDLVGEDEDMVELLHPLWSIQCLICVRFFCVSRLNFVSRMFRLRGTTAGLVSYVASCCCDFVLCAWLLLTCTYVHSASVVLNIVITWISCRHWRTDFLWWISYEPYVFLRFSWWISHGRVELKVCLLKYTPVDVDSWNKFLCFVDCGKCKVTFIQIAHVVAQI